MPERSPKHAITRHSRGWVKWINGRTRWVASFDEAPNGAAADAVYEARFSELWSEPAPAPPTSLTLADFADHFIHRKRTLHDEGALHQRTLDEYLAAVQDFCDCIGDARAAAGVTPADFTRFRDACAKRFGPHRLAKWVVIVRGWFKWGRRWVGDVDFGEDFRVPSRRTFRLHAAAERHAHGAKLFTPEDVRRLLDGARPVMRAMILLGCSGFGNSDLSDMPASAVDLRRGVIDYARGKTGEDRRVPLWPEQVDALRAVQKLGRGGDTFFVTPFGQRYVQGTKDHIAFMFARRCQKLGLAQAGRNFYSLRRTFRTIADECNDQRAVSLIMGHRVRDVGGLYVLHISDQRLQAVVQYVRARLLGGGRTAAPAPPDEAGAASAPPGKAKPRRGSKPQRLRGRKSSGATGARRAASPRGGARKRSRASSSPGPP